MRLTHKIFVLNFLFIFINSKIFGQATSTSNPDGLFKQIDRSIELRKKIDSILENRKLYRSIVTRESYNSEEKVRLINDELESIYKNLISDSTTKIIIPPLSQNQADELHRWELYKNWNEVEGKNAQLILIIILITIIVIVGYRYILTRNEIRELRLSVEVKNNTINSHLIVNLIGGPLQRSITLGDLEKIKLINEKIKSFISLHYTINQSSEKEIRLSDEINFLEEYIGIQLLRDSLNETIYKIQHEIDEDDLFEVVIPKMFIQPFLENAYEHTNDLKTVKILLLRDKLDLIVEITNKGKMNDEQINLFNSQSKILKSKEEHAIINTLRRLINFNKLHSYKLFSRKAVFWNFYRINNEEIEVTLTFKNIF